MARLAAIGVGRVPDVVPHGLDHRAFHPAARPGQDVLCIADFYPHKRHDIVVAAWAALPEPRPRLRLIGDPAPSPRHFEKIRRQAAELAHLGAITFETGLPLRELALAYRRARVLLLPSAHESFCLPLAESLASGVPVIARDLPQLRETAGGGALYIDGDDPATWSTALRTVLKDDSRHAAMRSQGILYAARYSWTAVADAVVERLVEERDV
jgi:glycosyltransferase involved in cell wall biosynthesis